MPLSNLADPSQLATIIRQMQRSFVRSAEPHRVFDALLPDLLDLTGSEHGFIAEVWPDGAGVPCFKVFAMTPTVWDFASGAKVDRECIDGIRVDELNTLFGSALVTGELVIVNEAPRDGRRGHRQASERTPIDTFLGVPLHYGGDRVGMIGMANRSAYDQALVQRLEPLFQSLAGIIAAVRLQRQRHEAERALQANDERWRRSFELAGAGVAHVDAQGGFLDVNVRMCQITGRTREELLRLRFHDISHPDDLADVDALRRVVAGEATSESYETRCVSPDGSVVWAQVATAPALDAQGRFLHAVTVVLDINQRRRAEQVLLEREAVFRKLADRVPGVLMQFSVDTQGHASVPYVSAALRELFELDPDGPVRGNARLMIERVVKGQRGRVWGLLEAGGRDLLPWALEFEVDLPQRGRRWLSGRGTPDRLPDGSTLWNGYIDDITERKRYEEALVEAQASRRANEAKTEFLSRMSHELRTPLNAVLGFTQLLASDPSAPLGAGQRERIGHIERAGQHLLAMIGDVLDLSQVEAGGLPLVSTSLPVGQLIEDVFALVAPTAKAADVALLQGGAPIDAALHVRADPMRLRQVLINLLTNAIKYNRRGGQVIVEAQDEPTGFVRLAVTDTGWGLTPAQQLHLFEPFNRLGAERSGIEGTGLGLAISLRLVELMSGRIHLGSEPGKGSTFVVELPRGEPPPPGPSDPADNAEAPAPAEHAPHTVLYAEDNELNVELVRQLLTLRPGCELRVARNGTEAIAMARATPPDLLLIDMHLGDMSGLDVLHALRDEPSLQGVPRIALSADALPQNIRLAREQGFDEYITKPVDVAEMLRCLARYLDGGREKKGERDVVAGAALIHPDPPAPLDR